MQTPSPIYKKIADVFHNDAIMTARSRISTAHLKIFTAYSNDLKTTERI
jgi:hypothetical protein